MQKAIAANPILLKSEEIGGNNLLSGDCVVLITICTQSFLVHIVCLLGRELVLGLASSSPSFFALPILTSS